MHLNMKIFHSLLAIVLLVSRCAGDDGKVITASHSATRDVQWTCPDPDAIFPCVCYDGDLDCSNVESEDQLAQIMGSSFPNPNFRSLTIDGNDNLRVLGAGDLGNTTYTWLDIATSALEEIEEGALSGSYATISKIFLRRNKLTSFPWEDMSLMTHLSYLNLFGNNISGFSNLSSDTLKFLDLSHNPLVTVEATAFSALPALMSISLANIGLTDVLPGTFVGLPNLCTVSIQGNYVAHLPEGTVQFPNCSFGFLDLSRNKISSVAVNAIHGFPHGGDIILWNNQLTVLEEIVWRPLLQSPAYLFLENNPLLCGCDIAWLVRNPILLGRIDTFAKCSSGELLVHLDPAIFDQC
ncbi:oplophorus-luciferin 2-monooxygenase non-catalytic subunit-like [Panulirus ornatus]|uniref:oplophorus-luciferin 2-monooxygenase non-catalytic subunit-like n=1 Tax=Panulirus ornatus TaxID=150431 RepID=UPI003A84ED8B